jgi:thiamine kinase-like enzyme
LDWDRNDWWNWSAVPKSPGLVKAFDELRSWVASSPSLVAVPIHGDFGVENLLVRNGRVAAVFDWEYARVDWAALEVGAAAMRFSPDDPMSFAHRYSKAGGPGEVAAANYGIRMWLLANCLYSLTCSVEGKPWNPEWVDFTLAKLRDVPTESL